MDLKKISEKNLKNIFSDCGDFESRKLRVEGQNRPSATAVWIDGLVNTVAVGEDIVRPFAMSRVLSGCADQRRCLQLIMDGQVYAATARHREKISDVVSDLLMGFVVLVFDSLGEAVSFDLRSLQSRAISEPSIEKTVKGAKGAFVETMRINTSLVRRHLRSSRLKLEQTTVGRKSGTVVAIMKYSVSAFQVRTRRVASTKPMLAAAITPVTMAVPVTFRLLTKPSPKLPTCQV